MSRAFIKEDAGGDADDLGERPQPPGPNYVTPAGLEQIRARVLELSARLDELAPQPDDPLVERRRREAQRDLRYWRGRLDSSILVPVPKDGRDQIRFGAGVEAKDESGAVRRFTIVGEDEADASGEKISWKSPLAGAVLGARAGEKVVWSRPAGDLMLEIVSVRYG